ERDRARRRDRRQHPRQDRRVRAADHPQKSRSDAAAVHRQHQAAAHRLKHTKSYLDVRGTRNAWRSCARPLAIAFWQGGLTSLLLSELFLNCGVAIGAWSLTATSIFFSPRTPQKCGMKSISPYQ